MQALNSGDIGDAEAILMEWILEDGNLIKSNRENIFNEKVKQFGFYSSQDAQGTICYNVLILAEEFVINQNGQIQLFKDIDHVDVSAKDMKKLANSNSESQVSDNAANKQASFSNKLMTVFSILFLITFL